MTGCGMRVRVRLSTASLMALVPGAALRIYPIHRPYPGLELQEMFPKNAIIALVHGDWQPFGLHQGSALLDLLRTLISVWYAAGRLLGVYHDRLDVLAAFVRSPLPFVILGRVVVCSASIASLWLVGIAGASLFGELSGTAAILSLGAIFIHVRESHHVWLDVPAATVAFGAAFAAVRAVEDRSSGSLVLAAALAGLAIAVKHSTFPIVLPIVIAAVLAGDMEPVRVARRLAFVGVVASLTYAVLSPAVLIHAPETIRLLRAQSQIMFHLSAGISLRVLVGAGIGWATLLLALVGLIASARQAPRQTAILAAFPVAYTVPLILASLLYARYLAVVAPFVALFAGYGATVAGRLLLRRWSAGGAMAIALLVAADPAMRSAQYDRLLARDDTQLLAGRWISRHIPFGTPLTVPNVVPYSNPILPPNADQLRLYYPREAAALIVRGLGEPGETYPARYLGFFDNPTEDWQPGTGFVVLARHPVVLRRRNPPPRLVHRLRAAGARRVATFRAIRQPLGSDALYDELDADYLPLRGFGYVLRPGPNITIWQLPGSG